MVRLKESLKSRYWDTVSALADGIKSAMDEQGLDPIMWNVGLESAKNVFDEPLQPVDAHVQSSARASGPRFAQIVIAAGTAEEVRAVRNSVSQYGARSEEWAPYKPDFDKPICRYAIEVALSQDILPRPVAIEANLRETIAKAELSNEIVVLIIDAWTAMLTRYREVLQSFDLDLRVNTAVVVPWNGKDQETLTALRALKTNLRGLLHRNFRVRGKVCNDSAQSLDEFQRELEAVLVEAQNLVFVEGAVARSATADEVLRIPRITGPVSDKLVGLDE